MKTSLNRILLVEDEPDIRLVTELSLRMLGGFTVESCATGMEALDRIEDWGPDLVLLDVMMPSMDGPSVLAELRRRPATREMPVVFMTARIQPNEVTRYKELGATAVVGKPFDPLTLPARLQAIWDGSHE
jgi:CheY-like chemotaxis protein